MDSADVVDGRYRLILVQPPLVREVNIYLLATNSSSDQGMSALGQKQTYAVQNACPLSANSGHHEQ